MPADQSPGQPPETTGFPTPRDSGEFDIRIARDGTWFHEGLPIRRKPLVKLFASVLWRDDDGVYWLRTPVEQGRIQVEDVPFTAVELSVRGRGRDQVLSFRSNLDDWVEADSDHPLRLVEKPDTGEAAPYILVRGGLEALILRPVYYELAELAVTSQSELSGESGEKGECLGVWSKGVFFPLETSR